MKIQKVNNSAYPNILYTYEAHKIHTDGPGNVGQQKDCNITRVTSLI